MNALVLCTSPTILAGFRGPRIPRRTATLIDHQLPLTWPGVPRLHAITPIAPWTTPGCFYTLELFENPHSLRREVLTVTHHC